MVKANVCARAIKNVMYQLIKMSCFTVADDGLRLLQKAYEIEREPVAKDALKAMLNSIKIAKEKKIPLCQSPGTTTIYVTLGMNVKIEGNIYEIVREAMRSVVHEGYIRPSVVHPISRANTGDGVGKYTPNVEITLESDIDYLEIIVNTKGAEDSLGAAIKLFKPADIGPNAEGVKKFILETVFNAAMSCCPPFALGIGLGGSMDVAAKLSRKCLVRPWDQRSEDPEMEEFEREMLRLINSLGIGPNGLGGDTTALTVNAEYAHTHIATLPVALNIHCWLRRQTGARIYKDGSFEFLKF